MINEFRLEDVVALCKGEVSLTVNAHANDYWTLEQGLADLELWADGCVNTESIRTHGNIYTLQFYPNTPIGFEFVAAGTLQEVIAMAIEILKKTVT